MSKEAIDEFAAGQSAERAASVRLGSKAGHEKRTLALFGDYDDPNALRVLAGQIKQHTIEHLDRYLEKATAELERHGARVHFAADAESACRQVADILEARGARRVVKAKTMVSEEIELAHYLEGKGVACVETDLGEFVVQINHDSPSHIVKPIIHMNRREVAVAFEENGLGAYDDTPEVITRRAREYLRKKYLEADAAITGANFVSAESGRVVLVTNEGNSRFSIAATRCHIALVGIEKLVPGDRERGLFLNLLARSGTGQQLTVYTEFHRGPARSGQPDGPDEMHVVFLDNGRSDILAGSCREILRCIRCGACLNVCPVYRQASGHAYRSVYAGPVGAVLSPLLGASPRRSLELADLPRASTLCGACHEVCPVDIPIEELLLRLRDKAKREGVRSPATPGMGAWSRLASQPFAWRAALATGGARRGRPVRRSCRRPVKAPGRRTMSRRRGAEALSARGSRRARAPMPDERRRVDRASGARPRGARAARDARRDAGAGRDAAPIGPQGAGGTERSSTAFVEQLARGERARVHRRARRWAAWLVERNEPRGTATRRSSSSARGLRSPRIAIDDRRSTGDRIDDVRFGITRAAGAIAETGTLILNDATTSSRLAALAPWIHVAVVPAGARSTVRVADAVRALGSQMNEVWSTAPSKTADVEGILIEGVHGPGEQIALLLD